MQARDTEWFKQLEAAANASRPSELDCAIAQAEAARRQLVETLRRMGYNLKGD